MNGKKTYKDYMKKKKEYNLADIKMHRLLQSFNIKYNIEQNIGDITIINFTLDDNGFILINITEDKYTDTWNIQFHEEFCEEFNVKLIKTEEVTQYHTENGSITDKLLIKEYTYAPKENKDFEEIKHLHLC